MFIRADLPAFPRASLLSLVLGVLLVAGCHDSAPSGPRIEGTPSFSVGADQSWTRSSFFADNTLYIDCLGEPVRFFGDVPFQYHEVTAGAGNFSFKYQLRPSTPNIPPFLAVGQTSGRVFTYKNGGPINESFHLGAGEVHTIIDHETYVAADGDRLSVSFRLHMTVNANGELTVFRSEFITFGCVDK